MVIIPKGRGEYRGVGLIEVIWKVYALIINNRIRAAITLHDALQGFRKGGGTGTATVEEKLTQNIAGIFHELLLQVLLDVQKPTTI